MNVSTTVAERPLVRPPQGARRGLPRGRLSGRHLVVLLAGVVAFVANLAVLRGDAPRTTVLVTANDLASGQRVTSADVAAMEVEGGDDFLDRFLPRLPSTEMVAVRDLPAGEPLRASDLAPPAALDPRLRRMSLPVEPAHAAGGRLAPGDRVDVIATIDDDTRLVAAGIEVTTVADRETRAFGTLGAFHVTVLVDPGQALCLASALAAGDIHLLLATGAEASVATGCPT